MTVSLDMIRNKPNPDIINELKDILAMAEKGELINFVLVAQIQGGQTLNAWGGPNDNVYTTFGRLMDMALMYRERNIE